VCEADDIPFGKRRGDASWFDSRRLVYDVEASAAPRGSGALDGSTPESRRARAAQDSWTDARRAARDEAKAEAITLLTPSAEAEAADLWHAAATGAQRLYGAESEGDTNELSSAAPSAVEGSDETLAFGQYLHEVLSTVDLGGKNLAEVARTLARAYGHSDHDVSQAIEIVGRTLSLPVIDGARRARRTFREVPVAGNTPDGRTQATIDLLFETSKGWRLVDFKTDKAPAPEALKKYSTQMASYASTLTKVLDGPILPCLCLVRSGELIECV
jgi:ATP-dependent exoDNAse (exonuclease V) beta subunit